MEEKETVNTNDITKQNQLFSWEILSHMFTSHVESVQAADILAKEGISAEVTQ